MPVNSRHPPAIGADRQHQSQNLPLLQDIQRKYPKIFNRQYPSESRLERLKATRQLFNHSPRVRFKDVSPNGEPPSHRRSASDDGYLQEALGTEESYVPERPATTLGIAASGTSPREELHIPLEELDEEPLSSRLSISSVRSLPTGRHAPQELSFPAAPVALSARAGPSPTPSVCSSVSGVSLRERLRDNSRSLHDLLYNKVPFRSRRHLEGSRHKFAPITASCETLHLRENDRDDSGVGRGAYSQGETQSHHKSLPDGLDRISRAGYGEHRGLSIYNPPSTPSHTRRQLQYPDLSPLSRFQESVDYAEGRSSSVPLHLQHRGSLQSPGDSAIDLESGSSPSIVSSSRCGVGVRESERDGVVPRRRRLLSDQISFPLSAGQDGDTDEMASTLSLTDDELEKSLFQQYLRVLALPSLGQSVEMPPSPTPSTSQAGDNSELEEIFSRAKSTSAESSRRVPSPALRHHQGCGDDDDDVDDTDPRLGLPDVSDVEERLMERVQHRNTRTPRQFYHVRSGSAPVSQRESPAPLSVGPGSTAAKYQELRQILKPSKPPSAQAGSSVSCQSDSTLGNGDPSVSVTSEIQTPTVPLHCIRPVSTSSERSPSTIRASTLFQGSRSRQGHDLDRDRGESPVQNLFGRYRESGAVARRDGSPRHGELGESPKLGRLELVEDETEEQLTLTQEGGNSELNSTVELSSSTVSDASPPLPVASPPSLPPKSCSAASPSPAIVSPTPSGAAFSPKKDNPARVAAAKVFSPDPLPPPTCMESAFDVKLKLGTRGKVKISDVSAKHAGHGTDQRESPHADPNLFNEFAEGGGKLPKKGRFPKLFGNKRGQFRPGLEEAAMMGDTPTHIQRPNSLPNLLSSRTPSPSPTASSKTAPSPVRSEGAPTKYPASPIKPAFSLAVVEIGDVETKTPKDGMAQERPVAETGEKGTAQQEPGEAAQYRPSKWKPAGEQSSKLTPYEQSVMVLEEQEGQSVEELMADDSRVRFRATPVIIPSPPESSQSETLTSVFLSQSEKTTQDGDDNVFDTDLGKQTKGRNLVKRTRGYNSAEASKGRNYMEPGMDTPRSVTSAGGDDTSDMEHVSPLSLDSVHGAHPDVDHLSSVSDETGVATLEQISDISEDEDFPSGYASAQAKNNVGSQLDQTLDESDGSHFDAVVAKPERAEDADSEDHHHVSSSVDGRVTEAALDAEAQFRRNSVDKDAPEETSGYGSPEHLDERTLQNSSPEANSQSGDATGSIVEKTLVTSTERSVEDVEDPGYAIVKSKESVRTAKIDKGEYAVVKPKPVRGQVMKAVGGEEKEEDAGGYAVVKSKSSPPDAKESDEEEEGGYACVKKKSSSKADNSAGDIPPTESGKESDYATVKDKNSSGKEKPGDNNYETIKISGKPPAGKRDKKETPKQAGNAQEDLTSASSLSKGGQSGASSPYATIAEVYGEKTGISSNVGNGVEAEESSTASKPANHSAGNAVAPDASAVVEEELYAAVDHSRKSSRGANSSQPTSPPMAGSDITQEEEGPPLPERQYKSSRERAGDLSGSRSSLFDNLKDSARSKLRSLRKAVSMERGLNSSTTEKEGATEGKEGKKKKHKAGKSAKVESEGERVRKAPSLKSLTGFFTRRSKRDHEEGAETGKASKGKKESKSRWRRGRGAIAMVMPDGIEAPTGMRSLGRVLEVYHDGSQMVELFRPESGPLGFYITQNCEASENEIFISRFAESHPAKLFCGLIGVGDEILEINGENMSAYSLDQVHGLLANPGKLFLRVLPLAARSDK